MKRHYTVEGNQLTATDSRYYYKDGMFIPSVSTILDAYPKDAGFYRFLKEQGENADNIRDLAADKGSNVHKLTEQYDLGEEVSLLNMDGYQNWSFLEWAMLERYIEFRNQVGAAMKIHAIECQLIDIEENAAGTLDRYVQIGDKHMIIDIKSGNGIYDSYYLQLAAYRRMFERSSGIKIDAVGILHLNSKHRGTAVNKIQGRGWVLIVREDSTNDLELWECTKKLWNAQNKGAKPNNVSYQLSYKQQ